jgi:membrane associated rhomboid family serine protease
MVTYTLIGINLAVFLVQFTGRHQCGRRRLRHVAGRHRGRNGEWWRLVTAAFLHGSFLHIAFNMYVLFALGPPLSSASSATPAT